MLCDKCGYPYTDIVYTRHNDMKNTTNRRRVCRKCNHRFMTVEHYRDEENYSRAIGK